MPNKKAHKGHSTTPYYVRSGPLEAAKYLAVVARRYVNDTASEAEVNAAHALWLVALQLKAAPLQILPVYDVDADRITGEWRGPTKTMETATFDAWVQQVDTDELHYDHYQHGERDETGQMTGFSGVRLLRVRFV